MPYHLVFLSVHPLGKMSIPFDIETYSGPTEDWQSKTNIWTEDGDQNGNTCVEMTVNTSPGKLVLTLHQKMNVSHVQLLAPRDYTGS